MIEFGTFLVDIFSWIFIVTGSCLVVLGAIGILRFRGIWARLHAASVIESGGMIFLLAGMCLQSGDLLIFFKLAFIGLFLFITGPTSTHALAGAILSSTGSNQSQKKEKS